MVAKIRWWISNDAPDWISDHFEYPVNRIFCFFLGHIPMPDQCNRPEHDLCAHCGKLMPFAYYQYEKDGTKSVR